LYGEEEELGLLKSTGSTSAIAQHNMTRLSCPVSFFLLSITSNMDASNLMALSSQVTMPHNVFDGRNNPIYSPSEGVFVI
jgi:hypothetical protein